MRRARVPAALVAALALAALALTACQTVVLTSRRDSSVGRLAFDRPLAIVDYTGYRESEGIRRAGEMALVNSLPELNLVPSYRDFTLKELGDLAAAKRRASREGYDGVLYLRVKEVRAQPGLSTLEAGAGGMTSVDGPSWTDVRVSAAVVSLADDRVVWTGLVDRRDDKGQKQDVRAIARAVAKQLRADGLVVATPR